MNSKFRDVMELSSKNPILSTVHIKVHSFSKVCDFGDNFHTQLAVVGDRETGKTSLIRSFFEPSSTFLHMYAATFGARATTSIIAYDDKKIRLQVSDRGGQV